MNKRGGNDASGIERMMVAELAREETLRVMGKRLEGRQAESWGENALQILTLLGLHSRPVAGTQFL